MMIAIRHFDSILEALDGGIQDLPFITMSHAGSSPPSTTCTFAEFLASAEAFAHLFQSHGIQRGDRIVLIMEQDVPLMASFVGAMLLGAVPTILAFPTFKIDPSKYRSGLHGVTRNIGARLVAIDAQFPEDLKAQIALTRDTEVIQTSEPPRPAPSKIKWANPSPDDVAFIQHSAGTTGLQKGVALSHAAVLNQLRHLAERLQLREEDRIVSWLPLYHDMGLIACFILPLLFRVHIVMQSPTDWVLRPASMLQLASDFRCTLCWIPNFAFQFLAQRVTDEDKAGLKLDSLRAVINCSEPVRTQSMQAFYDAYQTCGVSWTALHSSYAMAENTFAVTQTTIGESVPVRTIWADRSAFQSHSLIEARKPEDDAAVPFASSGRCLSNNSVRIVSADGSELEDGRVGEIAVHSDSMFDGYFNRPDLSEEVLKDEWYFTRDVGFILDGHVFVVGRKDDVIIIGGRNFYPQDIEEIVSRHSAIHAGRTVAFGLYSEEMGTNDLMIIAEVNDPAILVQRIEIEAEIRRSVVAEIGATPKRVHVVPPKWIIKSSAGKPARSATREKFLSENS